MENECRLIDAYTFAEEIESLQITVAGKPARWNDAKYSVLRKVAEQPTVDAVVLPCKIGDPVWFVGTNNINRLKQGVVETTVEKLILKSGGVYMKLACNAMYETSCRSIGKTMFFTREEAEAALAERRNHEE